MPTILKTKEEIETLLDVVDEVNQVASMLDAIVDRMSMEDSSADAQREALAMDLVVMRLRELIDLAMVKDWMVKVAV